MAVKLTRVSEKAYKQLQEIAKTEDISLRQALDIVVETRDRLESEVSQLKKNFNAVKWDFQYVIDQLGRKGSIKLPAPKEERPKESMLNKSY